MSLLSVADLLDLHDVVLAESGGCPGVLFPDHLELIVARADAWVFGLERFPGPFRKAASYAEGVATLHPFVEGNKRTAYSAAALYLVRNGYALQEANDAADTMVELALKTMSLEQFAAWLEANC